MIPTTGEHPASLGKAPSLFVTQDLLVLVVAGALFWVGAFVRARLSAPHLESFDQQGLVFQHPKGWLPSGGETGSVQSYQSAWDARSRFDVRISDKPTYGGSLQLVVDLARSSRYGEFYKRTSTEPVVSGQDSWLRTAFRYAHKASAEDAPQILHGIEYALVKHDRLFVVTVHGGEDTVDGLEEQILDSLAVR
jgi:hypothetical protein